MWPLYLTDAAVSLGQTVCASRPSRRSFRDITSAVAADCGRASIDSGIGRGATRELVKLRWGLVPSSAQEPSIGNQLINARSETAAAKPAFRSAMRHRRCLIPADGFYEWKKIGKQKQPYFIRRPDDKPFAFAGLWDRWTDPEGRPVETCTILTTDANDLLRPLHTRMPVIVEPRRLCDLARSRTYRSRTIPPVV